MQKPTVYDDKISKLATVPQACQRYKLSRNTLIAIAENEGCVRRFGRAVRLDIPALDQAIEKY